MRSVFDRRGALRLALLIVVGGVLSAAAAISGAAGIDSASSPNRAGTAASSSCELGNGISHVINIVFDNVHFSRDNPKVPSDLEQMPHLLNFLKQNGTVFSNSHTPMIAHTADDSLTIYTGLYGDRHGQPVSNSYKTYNPDGSTDPATSFTYWTSPIIDTKTSPPKPATTRRRRWSTPTACRHERRARADHARAVGAVHPRRLHGRRLLDSEHGAREPDRRLSRPCSARTRPRSPSSTRDPDPFKDAEWPSTSARPCTAPRATDLRDAQAVKFGPTTLAHGARHAADRAGRLQRLSGAVRRASTSRRRSAAAPNVFHNGYQVTDANGNLDLDLDGQPRYPRAVHAHARLPRLQPDRDADARRTSRTCRRPASR